MVNLLINEEIKKMKYFKNITEPNEIKKHYRKLAFQFHPDKAKDISETKATEIMKEINAQYHQALKVLDGSKFQGFKTEYTYKYNYTTEQSIVDKVNAVFALKANLTVEIIGTWLWVSGDSFEVRNQLKKIGLKFSGKKKAWYFHTGYYVKKSKRVFTMNNIREMYGVKIIEEDEKKGGKSQNLAIKKQKRLDVQLK
jgi:hypothetical protein